MKRKIDVQAIRDKHAMEIVAIAKDRKIPKTVDQAINKLIKVLSDKEKDTVRKISKSKIVGMQHFFLGRWIRNNFALWGGNYALLTSCGKMHPDNASSVIIKKLWEKLNEDK